MASGNPPIIPLVMIAVGGVLVYASIRNVKPAEAFKELFGQGKKKVPGAAADPISGPGTSVNAAARTMQTSPNPQQNNPNTLKYR